MVALSAAEQIDATFLPHQRQKTQQVDGQIVIVDKGVSWMGPKHMLEWGHSLRCAASRPGRLGADPLSARLPP
jgi:hypothetical protein